MDVELSLPEGIRKSDVLVEFSAQAISVRLADGTVLMQGPLHGRVLPSECSWALLEADPAARIRGQRLQLSLCKSRGSEDIWASVLDRDFLAANNSESSV
jgi:hypothetical protein